MDFLQHTWREARSRLESLSPGGRLLLGAVLITVLSAGFLVARSAATPELVTLVHVAPERLPAMQARLESAAIPVQSSGGRLMVPADLRSEAYAILAQEELLVADGGAAIDQMVKAQSPWQSKDQTERAYLNARRQVLGQIIGKMAGVRAAAVMLDVPEQTGFGAARSRPTASVNVVMEPGRRVERPLVDAVTAFVSGSVAEMKPQDVVIVDANQGRSFSAKDAEEAAPSAAIALVQALEQMHRERIENTLRYIPGVIVAVNVRTDPVLTRTVQDTTYASDNPIESESATEERREAPATNPSATPSASGAATQPADAGTQVERKTQSKARYGERPVTRHEEARMLGQTPKQVSVTVNVPRSYFVGLWQRATSGARAGQASIDPGDEDLHPLVDAQLRQIESQIEPLISTESQGVVKAHMVPDPAPRAIGVAKAIAGVEADVRTIPVAASNRVDWVKPAGLVTLALACLMVTFFAFRKGSPHRTTAADSGPGVATPADDADEKHEGSRKIAEQIDDLVKSNPGEAAALFNKWIIKQG